MVPRITLGGARYLDLYVAVDQKCYLYTFVGLRVVSAFLFLFFVISCLVLFFLFLFLVKQLCFEQRWLCGTTEEKKKKKALPIAVGHNI